MTRNGILAAALGFFIAAEASAQAQGEARWPQFRGVNSAGVAAEGVAVASEIDPNKNLLWKTALPRGHSSPIVWGDRIYLTGSEPESKNLETLCLDRATGKVLWRKAVVANHPEAIHELNNPASSTPVTDGKFVYSYFGTFGLVCYDRDGKEVWTHSMPPIPGRFGSGQSPALAGDYILLSTGSAGSYSTSAFDHTTGKPVWEKKRTRGFSQGLWSTPVIVPVDGGQEVLAAGGTRLCAYNLADGTERWFVTGLPPVSLNTPAAADGFAVLTLSNPIGDDENIVQLPTFDEALKKYDKNGDGKIQLDEIPADLTVFTRGRADKIGDWLSVREQARRMDADKDGALDRDEWAKLLDVKSQFPMKLAIATVCVRLGGKGDVTDSHVVWKQTKSAPEVPSPLIYQGRVYLVNEKGILTCRELASGKELYRERLNVRGIVYSSPVAGDGKVIVTSDGGSVVVLRAGDRFDVLSRTQFPEPIYATPALVDGKVYLRTVAALYAFGGV